MSDLTLRLGIVGAAVVLALVVIAAKRRRPASPGDVAGNPLSPGVYFFASSTCADCLPARIRLADELGESGFVEVEWEKDPDLFTALGVDVVPCTVVVADDGAARRYPGLPDRALQELGP